ncbi:MAG: ABC transporter ATP-binding protein [Eubacteriales bacterium]
MSSIELKNVSTIFSLEKVNLKINDGELMVVLGPTGAGKSTILNVIAGLEEYQGSVCFDDQPVDDLSVQGRNIGYLFQDLCLFPHMSVFNNVAFALGRLNISKSEIKTKVEEILGLLGIVHLKDRYPKNLSGGEKQRAALARALVGNPRILLFDEPMSSLDNRTSKNLIMEVHYLLKKLGITTIYVTHNFYEAEKMADRVVILENGHIEQIGSIEDIFFNPTERVSEFIGTPNILYCDQSYPINHGLRIAKCGDISLVMSDEGYEVKRIAILPEDLYITSKQPSGLDINTVQGVLTDSVELSFAFLCSVQVGDKILKVKLPKESYYSMYLDIGKKVWLVINLRKIRITACANFGVA